MKLTPAETALLDALDGATGWRAATRAALENRGLPNKRDEAWKWTDLRRLTGNITEAGTIAITGTREPDAKLPIRHAPTDILPRLAGALGGEARIYTLSEGESLSLEVTASVGVGHAIYVVEVPTGVSAQVRERLSVADGGFANIAVLYRIGEGASLDRIVSIGDCPGILAVSSGVDLGEGASLRQTTLTFGGKLVRLETHLAHPGAKAEAVMDAVYLLAPNRHADLTTTATISGPEGNLSQLTKGAVASHGHGVFQGKIHVEREAQRTDARMTHRALMLGDRAEIDAKPELEIYADDVQCAHGNALGAIDETALFYMRQRGLPEAQARAILIRSFLAEPLDRIRDPQIRDSLLEDLVTGLEALS
ncbi:SufD family Fe-S cluster assembly protein [Hyphobacterium sp. SN044]|uniref:SufD family Fe-S cluster assembly protein n=1 Tax=Hyphobacterium sp. SN044 TaxID=2912575 RepID=UPI001F18EEDA|nr:SufD family Fe-S cluster assembly protein [Hyphobacterium sp. SN044]MCF8879186.1 SufD family Fe-S cluster assembly protein [Hyphobacterium sp. SN044]